MPYVLQTGSKTPPEFTVQVMDDDGVTVLYGKSMPITIETTKAALDVFEEQVIATYNANQATKEAKQQEQDAIDAHVDSLFAEIGLDTKPNVEKPLPAEPVVAEPIAEDLEAKP